MIITCYNVVYRISSGVTADMTDCFITLENYQPSG
jgi:hypothetical protein